MVIAHSCHITLPTPASIIFTNMDSLSDPPLPAAKKTRAPRKCGICGELGHDKRKCPSALPADGTIVVAAPPPQQNRLPRTPSTHPIVTTTPAKSTDIIWEHTLFVVFDLETTGRSKTNDEITEIGAQVLDQNGIPLEGGVFVEFVKPQKPIPSYITALTNISNDDVKNSQPFNEVAGAFIRFMQQFADSFGAAPGFVSHIVLVGHNCQVFDIPFFVHLLSKHQMAKAFFEDKRFGYFIDTLRVARSAAKLKKLEGVPAAFNLGCLYQFVTGELPDTTHRALDDVKSTGTIFRFSPFWNHRKDHLTKFEGRDGDDEAADGSGPTVEDDDDSVIDEDDGSLDSTSSTSTVVPIEEVEEEVPDEALGDRWIDGGVFETPIPTPEEKFNMFCTSTTRREQQTIGLLVHPLDVNTPLKAWRGIFRESILQKIVRYTNEYGGIHSKDWIDIDRKDLECFFSVLFISGIQKRKDRPTNWFSNNRLLESPIMKKVMTGRRFLTILRYLHCCPAASQNPTSPDYDPAYKVAEVRDFLETRFTASFRPGQQLSLDETLIRAFGRMKFKVRIVTKAARYGIKVYVVTDARTAFVLKVIFYTGRSTYYDVPDAEEKKKTVQVVTKLVEAYTGSHRTIYVDRFYTSLDLVKALSEMDLYVTGTVLANRIPAEIRIAKRSVSNRSMKRGDVKKAKVTYRKRDGSMKEAGLVRWKDRQVVYCLSNDTNNVDMDVCKRRGEGGIITLDRPKSIANYNKYMGGVDLADMRRLHCPSTIMGQHRWWLHLFFYLLDVGTSNSLVIYNEAMKVLQPTTYTPMNIVDYKMLLVEGLIGKKIDDLLAGPDQEECEEHVPVHIEDMKRKRCVLCSLRGKNRVRTRFICGKCKVPLCCVGSGRVETNCFDLAHKNETIIELVLEKHLSMQRLDRSEN